MLKPIAIFVAMTIVAVLAAGLLGYSSCQQFPEYNDEAAKKEKTYENYCTTPYRVFTLGLFDIKEFVHENRDDINAFSTVVIAAFTIILGLFTISLAGSTRTAANAAALGTKAAIALELPLIRANVGALGYGGDAQNELGEKHNNCSVNKLIFYNHGRTNATLIEVQIGLTIGHKLPKKPIYLHKKMFPPYIALKADAVSFEEAILHQYDFDAPSGLYDLLRTKKTILWFYCNLIYLDFMDDRHEAGFCWKQYEFFGMGELRPDATPAYNRKT